MDHLPKFGGCEALFEVPYLCHDNYVYDQGGFDSYPERAGLRYEDLLTRTWISQPPLQDGAPFLQAWLYFGLLHEVFQSLGIDIDLKNFVVERNRKQYISTTSLAELMMKLVTVKIPSHRADYWRKEDRFSHAAWNESSRIVPYPKECLDRACQVSNNIIRHLNRLDVGLVGDKLCDLELVLLSIVVLGETLEVYRATGKGPGQRPPLVWTLPRFLERNLMRKGWCPFEIKTLYNKFPLYSYRCYTLCVLSSYNRLSLNYNHSACNSASCRAYHVDPDTYQTVHVTGPQKPSDPITSNLQCCQALLVEDSTAVSSIVNNGAIPLITVSRRNGAVQVACLRSHSSKSPLKWAQSLSSKLSMDRLTTAKQWVPKSRYVTISHVWSDGLGSSDNSLPICQLERLQSMVNALYPGAEHEIPFWIDTLCIPTERKGAVTTEGKRLRTKAIESMYTVYDGAEKVLVLDASIMRCVSSTSTLEEKVLTILCSPWGQRLWTYQEGVLARDLYFQFADGAISYSYLKAEKLKLQREKAHDYFSRMVLLSTSSERRNLKINRIFGIDRGEEELIEDTACLDPILQIWPILNLVGDRKRYGDGMDLQQLCWDVKDRSTSKWSDESICLTILMKTDKLPTIQHMSTPSEKRYRMRSLFCAFSEVNYELVLWKGPRYLEQNFRWIPTTLLTGTESFKFFFSRPLHSPPHISPIRAFVHPSGRLSIKQEKPALGFIYLQPENGQRLSPTNRIVLDTSAEDNPEYHSVTISTCKYVVHPDNHPPTILVEHPSWQSFNIKRLAVLFIREKPRTVTIPGINYKPAHPRNWLEQEKEVGAILVSYTDDPIYFEEDPKKRRRTNPHGQRTVCGGDFQFEANVESMEPISRTRDADFVVKARAYQTSEADCTLGGIFYPDRFKAPNWFIG